MNPQWHLDRTTIAGQFSPATVSRARHYATSVSITGVEFVDLSETYLEVSGLVSGSDPLPYQTDLVVQAAPRGTSISSLCSCPVGRQCKHGAALALLVAATLAEPEPTSSVDELDALLDAVVPDDDEPGAGVALRFALESPTYRFAGGPTAPTLGIRPMRPGAKQRWVKGGLGWQDVPLAVTRRSYDPAQLRPLGRLASRLAHHDGYWRYSGSDPSPDDFGPGFVELLREAVAAGVELLVEKPLRDIHLRAEPVSVAADVVRGADGGSSVRLGLDVDGRLVSGDEVTTYGRPAHTATLVDDGVLTIVALEPHLDPALVDALDRREPIVVPAADAEGLPARLRRLARAVPLASSDGSVDIPDQVAPRLRVTVHWTTASEAEVAWTFRYDDAGLPIDGPTPAGVSRDRAAERALLAVLDPPPEHGRAAVTGADALHLALLELPAWREVDGLEVVEVDPPDFREADEGPELTFDTAPPEGSGAVADDDATDWLDLWVVITVEGEAVPLPLVLEALTLDYEHVILPSGLFFRTDRPEFARLEDVVRAAGHLKESRGAARGGDDESRLRVARDDLGTLAQISDLGEVKDDGRAAEWMARARALRDLVELPTPEPQGVVSTLRPYQLDGFHWLAFLHQHGLGGILADDMGLGKTLQVLTLVAHARAEHGAGPGADSAPFLVVAPTSVVGNWALEAERHTPGLRVRTVTASGARRDETIADVATDADVVVTSYTLLRLESDDYAAVDWAGLVLDEAHQVKNHKSKAYDAVRALRAPFRLAVTGTPFENRLMELWSLLSIVAPGLYPQARTFTQHVVQPVEKGHDAAALRRFTRRIGPFVLRRTKELVAADLPPKQEQVLPVELGPVHRRLYDAHLAKERQRVLGLVDDDFDRNRVAILAAITRLRQLSLDPALLDAVHDDVGSAKLDTLLEHLLEITAEGHRALVFSSFTGYLHRVRDRLAAAGLEAAYLDGGTRDRPGEIERFRSGEVPVFLISLKAGGVGLTLTEADYVFVLDPWWNPAAEAQAVDRAHRIGQQRTVMVYRMVSTDTIEEKVTALQARKAALFAQVVDGEAGLAAGITADDIRGLFD